MLTKSLSHNSHLPLHPFTPLPLATPPLHTSPTWHTLTLAPHLLTCCPGTPSRQAISAIAARPTNSPQRAPASHWVGDTGLWERGSPGLQLEGETSEHAATMEAFTPLTVLNVSSSSSSSSSKSSLSSNSSTSSSSSSSASSSLLSLSSLTILAAVAESVCSKDLFRAFLLSRGEQAMEPFSNLTGPGRGGREEEEMRGKKERQQRN